MSGSNAPARRTSIPKKEATFWTGPSWHNLGDRLPKSNYIDEVTNNELPVSEKPKKEISAQEFVSSRSITDPQCRADAEHIIDRTTEAAEQDNTALLGKIKSTILAHDAGQQADAQTWQERVTQEPRAPAYPDIPPPPTEPPAKYAERTEIDPDTGRLEGVDKFLPRAYASWIVEGEKGQRVLMIPRKKLRELDAECVTAISKWPANHKGAPFPIEIVTGEPDLGVEGTPTAEQVREAQRNAQRAYRLLKANRGER